MEEEEVENRVDGNGFQKCVRLSVAFSADFWKKVNSFVNFPRSFSDVCYPAALGRC
jgi:hypothetical protein